MDWSPSLNFEFSKSPAYQALKQHFLDIESQSMLEWFQADPYRAKRLSITSANIHLDYSKNRVTQDTLALLLKLAEEKQLPAAIEAMFRGEHINLSENRPALHTALRNFSDDPVLVNGKDVMFEVRATLVKMRDFCWKVRNQHWRGYKNRPIQDIVSIGIGGSFLGPKLATEALKPYWTSRIKCHYLSNVDGSDLTEILRDLDPDTTLFIVQSKSFSTQETLSNARACKDWFLSNGGAQQDVARHFAAVTANDEAAKEFGISDTAMFPMWDWVGGRFSLWSAIGLPVMLTIGYENFRDMLQGAYEMDRHFAESELDQNIPVILGLLGVWYVNFFDAHSHALLPYEHYLGSLTDYIQQLDMESNGKSVDMYGRPVNWKTGPVIWGGVGTNGQHAYHQLLHQGTSLVPTDFIISKIPHNRVADHHDKLIANCLSQSQALMVGKSKQCVVQEMQSQGASDQQIRELAPQRKVDGNKPSNMIILDKLTPRSLGSLLAMYEHKVFVQGHIWGINSFDQWGVELGKKLANPILEALSEGIEPDSADPSTNHLISLFQSSKENL